MPLFVPNWDLKSSDANIRYSSNNASIGDPERSSLDGVMTLPASCAQRSALVCVPRRTSTDFRTIAPCCRNLAFVCDATQVRVTGSGRADQCGPSSAGPGVLVDEVDVYVCFRARRG
eukprot:1574736-Pleurochrysis_carterae.AAC.2